MSAETEIPVLSGQTTIEEVLPPKRGACPLLVARGHIIGGMESWSRGHSGSRICITCGMLADLKPPTECSEPRHAERYRLKLDKNNANRRERRAVARAAGTVHRKGRGRPENKAAYAKRKHAELRAELFEKLGGATCSTCGYSDVRALTVDHMNGGGGKHRRSVGAGTAYVRHLLDTPLDQLRAEFQVLCANCNAVKREELEEWRVANRGVA